MTAPQGGGGWHFGGPVNLLITAIVVIVLVIVILKLVAVI